MTNQKLNLLTTHNQQKVLSTFSTKFLLPYQDYPSDLPAENHPLSSIYLPTNQIHTVKKPIILLAIIIVAIIIGSSKTLLANENCLPYEIPEIASHENFDYIVYIDPTATSGGNGTITSPFNSLNGLRVNNALPANTAYLIKRGTQLDERIYAIINDSYIGSYGEGERAIIFGGIHVRDGSANVTIDNLNIRAKSPHPTSTGYSSVILAEDNDVWNLTIANSLITGVYDGSMFLKYPYRCIKARSNNLVIFNNHISHCFDDAVGTGSGGGSLTMVRNYIHHMDLKRVGNEYTDTQPGAQSDGSEFSFNCGDGIHTRMQKDLYIAGNYVDRSATSWKFAFILKSPWSESNYYGAKIEYNTFVGNNGGPGGGAVVYLEGPQQSTLKRNVFDSTNKGSQTGPGVIYDVSGNGGNIPNQQYPYGVYDNHLIRGNTSRSFYYPSTALPVIEENNELFTGYNSYESFLSQNQEIGLYGSDINPLTFLTPDDDMCGTITPETYTLNIDIAGNGTVSINPEKNQYDSGETVTLTAIPDAGWNFHQWTGSANGNDLSAVIVMNENKSVTANFTEATEEPEPYVVQSASGLNTATFQQPATAGNLLVAVLSHRQDPMDNPDIPEGFTLREVIQFKSHTHDRHGVLICDKIADGTETVFNTSFGTITDLGGIVIEFDLRDVSYYDANSTSSGTAIIPQFTENVPQPSSAHLSVSAVVSRNATQMTDWNNEFVSPLAGQNQMGVATRLDTIPNKPSNVSVQNNGDQGALIVASWILPSGEEPDQSYLINTSATGNGELILDPYKEEYLENEVVTITAAPQEGWSFSNWTGDLSGNTNPVSITIDEDKNIGGVFIINSYTLNSSASPLAGGQTTGSGDYTHGQIATIMASPAEGYSFVNWTENGIVVSSQNQYSFTVTKDRNLIANFSLNEYNINLSSAPSQGGSVSGSGDYNYGETVQISANASEGYSFVSWSENGTLVSQQPNYTFTAVSNRTLVANFAPLSHSVSLQANPVEGGQLTGGGVYENGETVNINAEPNAGYSFINWTHNGTVVSNQTNYSFSLNQDMEFIANFSLESYQISLGATPEEGGSVTGDGNYNPGSIATVVAVPGEGYDFVNWTEDGAEVSGQEQFSFEVTEDRHLTANFELKTLLVNVSANPAEGGSVSGGGIFTFGETASVLAIPAEGYTFTGWTENGKPISNAPDFSFVVTENWNLVANFSVNAHTLTLGASPVDGGTVEGSGIYDHGQSVTISAAANEGYDFINWTENGEILSSNPVLSFELLDNRNIIAVFEENTYELNLVASPEFAGSISGAGMYTANSVVQVTATPNTNYSFDYWTLNGIILSTEMEFEVTLIQSMTLVAHFASNSPPIFIDTEVWPAGAGFAFGGGEYLMDQTVELKALPVDDSFKFVGWFIDDKLVSKNPVISFIASSYLNYNAVFDYNSRKFNVEASISDDLQLPAYFRLPEIIGAGTYEEGEMAKLKLLASKEITFVGWKNDAGQIVSRQNPYLFEVNRNINLEAVLKIDKFAFNSLKISPNPSNGNFRINLYTDSEIQVLNAQGFVLERVYMAHGDNSINISHLPPGIYLIRVLSEGEVFTQKAIIK